MESIDPLPPPFDKSDAILDAEIETIINQTLPLYNLTLSPHHRNIFKLGIVIGMRVTYQNFLKTPLDNNNSISK